MGVDTGVGLGAVLTAANRDPPVFAAAGIADAPPAISGAGRVSTQRQSIAAKAITATMAAADSNVVFELPEFETLAFETPAPHGFATGCGTGGCGTV